MKRSPFAFVIIVALLFGVTGCSLKYAVDAPPAPGFTYANPGLKPIVLKVVDQRDSVKYMVGISGLQRVDLVLENVDDPVVWLSKELVKELKGRGVAVRLAEKDSEAADMTLTVKKFQLINHHATGFSAWESYNVFMGQLATGGKNCSIPAFFFNSKIPVWSMDEIRKPCVSDPMGIIVKDVAPKINTCAFNYSAADADVQKLEKQVATAVETDKTTACFPLTDLAGTNNPAAMATLKRYAGHDDSFVHNCAVHAMGILGAQDQFDFLVGKFEYFAANDKISTLKAIGDIGTPKARDFLRNVQKSSLYNDENGVRACTDLYLSR